MKKLLLLLVFTFLSAQSIAASCPDGSEPVKSISADGGYYVYNCDNSMEGTPFMNRGTSYKFSNGNWFGSDGMKCRMTSDISWSCNNGVSYQMCGQGKSCGADGTTYQSQNDYVDGFIIFYTLTSFGVKCLETGNVNNQTYRCL